MKKKKPKRREEKKQYKFGEVLSMDTDVMAQKSLEGHLYRQDVIDHGTCWMWGPGMERRNEYKQFLRDILSETKGAVTEIRVGGAQEFQGEMMQQLAKEFKFKLKTSARYTHEHDGKIERAHQTVDQMAKAMMNTAKLPLDLFWSLAGQASVYIKNRMGTKGNDNMKSPYEMRYGVQPDLSSLKIFGCEAIVYRSKESGRSKTENSGKRGMFVGYSDQGPGYLIMDLDTMEIQVEGNVDFYEEKFPGENIDWRQLFEACSDEEFVYEKLEESEEEASAEESYDNSEEKESAISSSGMRRSARSKNPPDRGLMVAYAVKDEKTKMNYQQAMKSKHKQIYRRKIVEYLRDLLDKKAIELVPRAHGQNFNLIKSRWVCYRKYVNGHFEKTKVRWTPLGYMQKKGVDYAETFAPVAVSVSNRLIYVIANRWNRKVKKK